jgi:hypothetical protein
MSADYRQQQEQDEEQQFLMEQSIALCGMSQQRLKELLSYDAESGVFTWKISRGSSKAGDVAGCLATTRYWRIRLDNRFYLAHRLAWLYAYGNWPEHEVDHINGNKSDNRIVNLREATHSENTMNIGIKKHNTSGAKGVTYHKQCNKWQVYGRENKKPVYLGIFDSKDEAADVYKSHAKKHHGRFFNDGRKTI